MSDFLKLFDNSTVRGRLFNLINEMSPEQQTALLRYAEGLMQPKQEQDLRKSKREKCSSTAYLAFEHRVFKNEIIDISEGGVFIATKERFIIGQHVLVSLVLPKGKKPVKVQAEVVWKNADGIGVKFLK